MSLDKTFITLIENFRIKLSDIQKECKKVEYLSLGNQDTFLKKNKSEFFKLFDFYFFEIWKNVENLDEKDYLEYQNYLIKELDPYLRENLEIVSYIRARPLGYAGDYVTMNYIYDYNENQFLGKSLYEKLMNHYTCSIKVSCSNIARKNFLKQLILDKIDSRNFTRILSVGCGPARELVELLKENKIKRSVEFNCLDFEEKAIMYVKEQLERISYSNEIKINFFSKNLLDLVKSKELLEHFRNTHLLYISGVFDYFTDRLCKKTVENLCPLLAKNGQLIIFNMSLENASHRAYYETFAKWEMKHRTKENMLSWFKDTVSGYKLTINDTDNCPSYHILNIIRE